MYVRGPRKFCEGLQNLLKQSLTPIWYPIKAGQMGNKPHKNQYSKVAYTSFQNNLEKSQKETAATVFVMKLTTSKISLD